MKNQVRQHGEALIITIDKIPSEATLVADKMREDLIIADSETTGNHHLLQASADVSIFKINETYYAEVRSEAVVKCAHDNRHDEIKLPVGNYQFDIAREYDPFAKRVQNVRD